MCFGFWDEESIVVNSSYTWGCSNVICNTVIITTTYRFNGKFDNGLDSSWVGFAPLTMEGYSVGSLGVTAFIVWLDACDYVTQMPEHVNKKEEQNW